MAIPQISDGLTEDGWAGQDTVAKIHELAALAGATIPQLPTGDIPADYWPMLSLIESGGLVSVSAGGL